VPGAPSWTVGLLAIVLVSGAVLRGVALDRQGYWHDEIYSVSHLSGFDAYLFPGSDLEATEPVRSVEQWSEDLAERRWAETLPRNLVHEGHPPLYQLALKAWTRVFGTSVWGVRSFSLVPGLVSILILYLLASHFWGRGIGLVAATLTAASPFQVYFSMEARNYTWAILFTALAVLAISQIWSRQSRKTSGWMVLWWLSVMAASYTHYYAGLYCGTLLLLSVGASTRQRALHLTVPFLVFVPWLPMLRSQLGLHSESHWTAGAPGFIESISGFVNGMLDQLTGVFGSAGDVERSIAAAALLAALLLRAQVRPTVRIPAGLDRLFLSIPLFALLVVCVDLITNHHTILVPRYSSSALPALTLLVVSSVALRPRIGSVLVVLLCTVNLFGSIETARGLRAPKQMLREAAAYITNEYDDGDVVLVTPSGPTLVGIARYLPSHVMLGSAAPSDARLTAERLAEQGATVWLVTQRLGAAYEMNPQDLLNDKPPVRFVGLDLVRLEGAR